MIYVEWEAGSYEIIVAGCYPLWQQDTMLTPGLWHWAPGGIGGVPFLREGPNGRVFALEMPEDLQNKGDYYRSEWAGQQPEVGRWLAEVNAISAARLVVEKKGGMRYLKRVVRALS